jgi:hypothetical protein
MEKALYRYSGVEPPCAVNSDIEIQIQTKINPTSLSLSIPLRTGRDVEPRLCPDSTRHFRRFRRRRREKEQELTRGGTTEVSPAMTPWCNPDPTKKPPAGAGRAERLIDRRNSDWPILVSFHFVCGFWMCCSRAPPASYAAACCPRHTHLCQSSSSCTRTDRSM